MVSQPLSHKNIVFQIRNQNILFKNWKEIVFWIGNEMNENERRLISNKSPFKKQMFRLSRMKFQACQVLCKIANKIHMIYY